VSRWRTAPEFAEGIRLFDAGATRAAHESFEEAWRAQRGTALGEVARALAQWAAACVHLEEGRAHGFQSLAAKCADRLAQPEIDAEFGTRPLSAWMARAAAASAGPGVVRPLPR